jgi:hypothetical protein
MRVALGSAIILISVAIGVGAQAQQTPPPAGQQQTPPPGGRGPQKPPQNLQVLPKDIAPQELTRFMRSVAGALGVECTHCHVSMQDRASDDKPTKLTARKMLKMTMTINNDLLKDVGEPPAAGTQKVTCYTCHRGALKPLTAAPAGGGTFHN